MCKDLSANLIVLRNHIHTTKYIKKLKTIVLGLLGATQQNGDQLNLDMNHLKEMN